MITALEGKKLAIWYLFFSGNVTFYVMLLKKNIYNIRLNSYRHATITGLRWIARMFV